MSRERRQYPRISAKIEVSFATAASYVTEYTKNISKGGAFLKTDSLPDPNALVELTIGFPGTEDRVSVLARVVRSVTLSHPEKEGEHIYGVGFHFVEWDETARSLFDKHYERLAEIVPIEH